MFFLTSDCILNTSTHLVSSLDGIDHSQISLCEFVLPRSRGTVVQHHYVAQCFARGLLIGCTLFLHSHSYDTVSLDNTHQLRIAHPYGLHSCPSAVHVLHNTARTYFTQRVDGGTHTLVQWHLVFLPVSIQVLHAYMHIIRAVIANTVLVSPARSIIVTLTHHLLSPQTLTVQHWQLQP